MYFGCMENLDILKTDAYTKEEFLSELCIYQEILDYAEKNNIHTMDELDDERNPFEIQEVFDALDLRVSNTNVMKPDMKDLSPIVELYNRLIAIFSEDEDFLYFVIQKVNLLFKMRKYDEGEAFMMQYINQYPDEGNLYIELMFDFDAIAQDTESALYYGRLALARENLKGREEVEDILADLE